MRAIEIIKCGTANVLQICERPVPLCKENEVLIKVSAAGVNRSDILQKRGSYPAPPGVSEILGLEISGEILSGDLIGSNFNVGDRVCALVGGGGYAEYCVAPIKQCLPVPVNVTLKHAASLPETYFTVWSNIFENRRLGLEGTLLVHGGTSGIGVAAIQMASAFGHTVFATASTDEKCRFCEMLGAQIGINYQNFDFESIIKNVTNGVGVNLILDIVGGQYIQREIKILAEGGYLVILSVLGGSMTTFDVSRILSHRLVITGSTLRARSVEFKARIATQLKQYVWPLFEKKIIKPIIYRCFPLEQAEQAHILMKSSTHIGKIILTVNSF